MKTKIIALILAMLALMAFASCGNTNTVQTEKTDAEKIIGKGTLVVGITDYAPMDYQDDNGEWTGFDAEFARLFADSLGITVEFVEIDWDNKFLELKSGAIDCIWNGMTIGPDVLANTACSDPYINNSQVVVMKADKADAYTTAESMVDLKVAVEAGSAGQSAGEENNFNLLEVTGQTDALMEVASGSSDACIIDETMAKAMTGEGTSYADLKAVLTLTAEEYGVGFRVGSDMVEKLNAFMDANTDALKKLADKYDLSLAD